MSVWQEITNVFTIDNFLTIFKTISNISIINLIMMTFIPAIIIYLLLRSNKLRPQPWYLTLLALMTGIITVSTAFVFNLYASDILGWARMDASATKLYLNLDAMYGVGLVEEAIKIIFIILFIRQNKKCHAPYDGVIYGALIGLSFAIVENMMPRYSTSILRLFTSVPLHMSCGVIAGYFLSISTINKNKSQKRKQDYLAFFIPAIVHGTYNGFSINAEYLMNYFPNLKILIVLTFILIVLIIYVIIYIILYKTYKLNHIYYNNGQYPRPYNLYTVGEIFKKDLKDLVNPETKYENTNFIE